MNGQRHSISTMRLYGGAIAIVSGIYSINASMMEMGAAGTLGMVLLGLIVLLHGVALLTPLARRLDRSSGPLMIVYAVWMLLNQWWMIVGAGPEELLPEPISLNPTADPGMLALAVLMLISGIIMTTRRDAMA